MLSGRRACGPPLWPVCPGHHHHLAPVHLHCPDCGHQHRHVLPGERAALSCSCVCAQCKAGQPCLSSAQLRRLTQFFLACRTLQSTRGDFLLGALPALPWCLQGRPGPASCTAVQELVADLGGNNNLHHDNDPKLQAFQVGSKIHSALHGLLGCVASDRSTVPPQSLTMHLIVQGAEHHCPGGHILHCNLPDCHSR